MRQKTSSLPYDCLTTYFFVSSHFLHQRSPFQFSTSEIDQYRRQTSPDVLTPGGHLKAGEDQTSEIVDDVDGYPSHRSPLLSECRTDASDIPQATYIVLSSEDIMQLTVTRAAVDVLSEISVVNKFKIL